MGRKENFYTSNPSVPARPALPADRACSDFSGTVRVRAAWLIALALTAGLEAAGAGISLVDAVRQGNQAAVRELIAQRRDVNTPEADGTTALHWAVRANDGGMVGLLLRAGARADAANRYGIKPLTLAAINGNAAVIETLLDAGADPNSANAEGETALMTAARTGSVDAVRRLAARGANVNVKEGWLGETALMWAASENHAAVVRALAELGADIDTRSAVHEAPVLQFPRSGGPNAPLQRGGWTALMYAARDGALDAARVLVDRGASLNAVALPPTDVVLTEEMKRAADRVGTTALVFAIINAHYDLAAMLLEKGADPNIADASGMAALYAAVDMSSLQWVQGRPAPILTDKLEAASLVRLLLARGADPNARLKAGPLKRHHDAASTLNFGRGTTPLMRAARTNDVAVLRLLLDAGADPFLTQPDHTTSLMIAAGLGYNGPRGDAPRIPVPTEAGAVEAVTLLIDRGVDVNAFNDAGQTALHGAVTRGDAVVKLLAERGAILTAKNKAGQTPLDLALGGGGRRGRGGVVRESTAALLRQLIARSSATNTAP